MVLSPELRRIRAFEEWKIGPQDGYEEDSVGTTEILARHIVETTYDSLPAEVVRAAKDVILDGVGVMLAGSREEPPRIVAEYAREMGGPPRCTVFGLGFKTSPPMAAFVNGVSGHVLDYEPMWHPATHATSPTLPSILALAETRAVSGKDVITALALAFEVQGRAPRRLRHRADGAHRLSSTGHRGPPRGRRRRRGAPWARRAAHPLGPGPRGQP
jgi:2-methylcitrate dehydratase PrpD